MTALRRRGVDARLVVFERYRFHPRGGRGDPPAAYSPRASSSSCARLSASPRADVFHFYFGLTLIPRGVQFALLHAFGRKAVLHYLGSDIRGKPPEALAWGRRADAGDRRLVRRDPLGTPRARDPSGSGRPGDRAHSAERRRAPGDPARAIEPPAQGHRRGRRRGRRPGRDSASSRACGTTRRSSATGTPTSSSTSSTPAGTASSRSRQWRSASRCSRSCTTRRCAAPGAARRPRPARARDERDAS